MPIISTKEGININSEHVVQFTTLRNGQSRFLLSTGGEQTCEPYSEVIEHFTPVIPANPGFVAVFADRADDEAFQYRLRSVIAWRLCPSGAYPLFAGYGENDDDYEVIVDPAGGVFDSDHTQFSSLEDWQKEFEAEAVEHTATAAAA
jgi:hypothetical protein